MTSQSEAESAVRNYLLFLDDPAKLVDQQEVARLEAELRSVTDPIEKLRVINRLKRINDIERDGYRRAFCEHAKAWADANDIDPASFLDLGVDDSTMRAAGFSVRRGHARGMGRASSEDRDRHVNVRVEQVKEAVSRQAHDFTLADLAATSGGSPMTIRKAVDELIAAGQLERLGPTPNWSQPGRAPIRFRRISKRSRR